MAMALSLTSLLVVHALPHGRCWHHADIPVMIVNKEKRMVLDILTPINRAAVQLHRLSPTDVTPAVRLQLAHRMMRIHDRFEDTCYDHEWEDALAHKLCATHVRHAAAFDMLAAIAADTGALSNFTAQTRSVARCLTMQLDRVRRACHNHVTPWTPEHTMCDDVLADRACRWISPFAGMCDHRLRVHYGRANRKMRQPLAHQVHGTDRKHSGWSTQRRAEESERRHREFRTKMGREHPRRASRVRTGSSPPSSSSRVLLSTPRTRHRTVPGHIELVVILLRTSTLTARTLVNTDDARVCVDAADQVLMDAVKTAYPRLRRQGIVDASSSRHTGVDGVVDGLVRRRKCEAAVVWRVQAEFVHLHPCGLESLAATDTDYCASVSRRAFGHATLKDPNADMLSLLAPAGSEHAIADATEKVCARLHAESRHGQTTGGASEYLRTVCAV